MDTENRVLRIPKEESAKNTEHWIVGLSDRTSTILVRWQEARGNYAHYDTDAFWLTRKANHSQSGTLRYLLYRL